MLKAVPNKNAGFIILLTSIFIFFFFGEIRNLTTFTRLMDYNNGFSISSFFFSLLSFLWIGAQFPQEKFLSYGRILTLHYYFLLMCILFSFYKRIENKITTRRKWRPQRGSTPRKKGTPDAWHESRSLSFLEVIHEDASFSPGLEGREKGENESES